MGYNNKHILEENSDDEIFLEGLLSYVDDKIKSDNHENIALRR